MNNFTEKIDIPLRPLFSLAIMHGFLASDPNIEDIDLFVKGTVQLADKLIEELGRTSK
jgi:hypothetical protein